jgi:nicotinamidase-related amidase
MPVPQVEPPAPQVQSVQPQKVEDEAKKQATLERQRKHAAEMRIKADQSAFIRVWNDPTYKDFIDTFIVKEVPPIPKLTRQTNNQEVEEETEEEVQTPPRKKAKSVKARRRPPTPPTESESEEESEEEYYEPPRQQFSNRLQRSNAIHSLRFG